MGRSVPHRGPAHNISLLRDLSRLTATSVSFLTQAWFVGWGQDSESTGRLAEGFPTAVDKLLRANCGGPRLRHCGDPLDSIQNRSPADPFSRRRPRLVRLRRQPAADAYQFAPSPP
jgi:hypothetical protein